MNEGSERIYRARTDILNLFSNLGIEYLSSNRINIDIPDSVDLRKSKYYRGNRREFLQLEQRYKEQLVRGDIGPVYIGTVNRTTGYGLFSAEALKKGAFIGQYTGIVSAAPDYESMEYDEVQVHTAYTWDYPDDLPGCPELEISALKAGNETRFVNHSFLPSLDVEHTIINNEWVIFFVANRDLPAESHLTADYGDAYWADTDRILEL